MILLINAINGFAQIIIWLLVGRAICSWFVRDSYGTAYKIYQVLTMVTEPIVAPCRKITSRMNTGMLDVSVLMAFLVVIVVREALVRLLLLMV